MMPAQLTERSIVETQSNRRSICARSTMSGGDSAMVSPVTRISTPASKAFTNTS